MINRIQRFTQAVIILLILLAALSACSPSQGTGETPPVSAPGNTGEGVESLVGSRWQLLSLGEPGAEDAVLDGTQPTLRFEENGVVNGSGGCNSFGGQYQVDGERVVFTEIVRTLLACADASISQQEDRYLQALEAAGRFEIEGDQLMIFYADGTQVLNFERIDRGQG